MAATYVQLWWPSFDQPVYIHRQPLWDGRDYIDADTGEVLPTWQEALDQVENDSEAHPANVMRFGRQIDMAGIIAPSSDADRAVRYLTKSIADAHVDAAEADPRYAAHIERLYDELRYLPCSPACANWLRYGIQPDQPGPGMHAGHCTSKAHDSEHLGLGGRRVLVSRHWSSKTLTQHKADRATVVREALLSAGIVAPEVERMAATVTLPDGTSRFAWIDSRPDRGSYAQTILASIAERLRWRAQYEAAKQAVQLIGGPVDNHSATGPP